MPTIAYAFCKELHKFGGFHDRDDFDCLVGPIAHRFGTSVAVQPKLGILSFRISRNYFGHPCHHAFVGEVLVMSRASIGNHPIHPMFVVFPIGLWIFSLVCDIAYHAGSHNVFWKGMAFYTIAGGIIGALLAAVPGFIDYLTLQDRETKRIATTHMILNLIVVALFIFNLGIRYNASVTNEVFGVILSVVAIAVMTVSGWLGGDLVYIRQVGVQPAGQSKEQERRIA
jgi:uncharacterized membrane protein